MPEQTHPCIEAYEKAIASLMAWDGQPIVATPEGRFVPRIYFSWDTEESVVSLELSRRANELLSISAKITGSPRWLSMNFELGPGQFEIGNQVGLIYKFGASRRITLTMDTRSGLPPESVLDTPLAREMKFDPEQSTYFHLHKIQQGDGLHLAPSFHTLLIHLPRSDFEISLQNCQMFVRPK